MTSNMWADIWFRLFWGSRSICECNRQWCEGLLNYLRHWWFQQLPYCERDRDFSFSWGRRLLLEVFLAGCERGWAASTLRTVLSIGRDSIFRYFASSPRWVAWQSRSLSMWTRFHGNLGVWRSWLTCIVERDQTMGCWSAGCIPNPRWWAEASPQNLVVP